MADRDFNIRIVTTADTSGFKEASAAADDLAARTRKASAVPAGWQAPVDVIPIPPALLKKTGAFGEGGAGIEGLTAKAAEADRTLKTAAASGLLLGANMRRARQEATTFVRELATGAPTTRTLSALLGNLPGPLLIAGVAAITLGEGLKNAVERSIRLQEEFGKGLDTVQKLAEKVRTGLAEAISPEQVVRVAQEGASAVEAQTAKVNALQNQYLGLWKTIGDEATSAIAGILSAGSGAALSWKPFQNQADKVLEQERQIQSEMQGIADAAVRTAIEVEKAFESKKVQPFSEAIQDSINTIKVLRDSQNSLKETSPTTFAKDYADFGRRIEDAQKNLAALSQEESRRHDIVTADSEGERSAQSKLNDEISYTRDRLIDLEVHARTPAEAFLKGQQTAGGLGALIEQLARQWANLNAQAAKTSTADLFKGPATQAQESLNRIRDVEADIARRREEAAETGTRFTGDRERSRAAAEEELRNLQRYQTLQRSLFPEGAGPAEQLKALGAQGLEEFEKRQERIKELRRELGLPVPAEAAAPTAYGNLPALSKEQVEAAKAASVDAERQRQAEIEAAKARGTVKTEKETPGTTKDDPHQASTKVLGDILTEVRNLNSKWA